MTQQQINDDKPTTSTDTQAALAGLHLRLGWWSLLLFTTKTLE